MDHVTEHPHVWKIKVPTTGHPVTVDLPEGHQVLTAQLQGQPRLGEEIFISVWVQVVPARRSHPRTFQAFGTGHPLPSADYCGTVQLHNGALVLHVYEMAHSPRSST